MKKKLLHTMFMLAMFLGAVYFLKPEKVDAGWDFNRHTGTWTVTDEIAYCKGSWWSNSCIGTLGYYDIETGTWHDW